MAAPALLHGRVPYDSAAWCIACAWPCRRELGLGRVHLLGHGWGGMLALAYLTQAVSDGSEAAPLAASGVASLTLLSTPPSWTALVQDRRAKVRTTHLARTHKAQAYKALTASIMCALQVCLIPACTCALVARRCCSCGPVCVYICVCVCVYTGIIVRRGRVVDTRVRQS